MLADMEEDEAACRKCRHRLPLWDRARGKRTHCRRCAEGGPVRRGSPLRVPPHQRAPLAVPPEHARPVPGFPTPSRPDAAPIALLHRGTDPRHGVQFARRVGQTGMETLFMIPAHELLQWFPQFLAELDSDSFMTVNGFLVPNDRGRRSSLVPELPLGSRKRIYATFLTSCFVDLDTYRPPATHARELERGIPPGVALGMVLELANRGEIPHPSLLQLSGRGAWAYWILRGPDGGGLRAHDATIARWDRVQRAICEQFAALGSDANAGDVSRLTRVPGSLNTKAGARSSWQAGLDDNGNPRTYTLDELVQGFRVSLPPRHATARAVSEVPPEHRLKGFRGHLAKTEKNLRRFEALRELRGVKFRVGTRQSALWIYSGLLVSLRKTSNNVDPELLPEHVRPFRSIDHAGLYEAVRDLADDCERGADFNPADAARAALNSSLDAGGLRSMAHQTIADRLNVTPEEAASLRTVVSEKCKPWPCATCYQERLYVPRAAAKKPDTRSDLRERRRKYIRAHIDAGGGNVPPLRELVEALRKFGLECSLRTVMKDLAALGIDNPRARELVRRKKARAPLFDAPPSLEARRS